MYRFPFLIALISLVMLLTACPAEVNPPCTGDDCPRPCKNVAPASFSSGVFTSESTFSNCYVQGSSYTVSVKLTPKTTTGFTGETGIVVFDVVKNDGANYPTVLADMFQGNNVQVTPNIFSNPIAMSQLRAGIAATAKFTLKSNAPKGDLVFVISAFRGTDATSDANLIGRAFYYFKIE